MYAPVEKVTAQGYDLHFGANVLGTQRCSPHKAGSHPQTCDGRSLLSHPTSSPRPHGDRKEGPREDRARGQCELSGSLYGSPGGHPMDHDHPGDGIVGGTQEAWLCQAVWPEQDGTDPIIASDTTISNPPNRGISSFRTSSRDDTAAKASCPFPSIREPPSLSMQAHSSTASDGSSNMPCITLSPAGTSSS